MVRFQIIKILRWFTLILLFGRAWQHLFWDAPYQYLFTPKAGFTQWFVDSLTMVMGWFFVLGVCFIFTLDNRNKRLGYTFVIHSAALLLLGHLYRAENACELATFFLYTAQFSTPLLYYLALFSKMQTKRIMGFTKMALTLTLGSYAWYAMGWVYGQPVEWLESLQQLGVSAGVAPYFLIGLGSLEFILVVMLWVKPLQRLAFPGILVWGGLLMLASVVLYGQEHAYWKTALRSAWELLCLLPNAGLALALWRYVYFKDKRDNF